MDEKNEKLQEFLTIDKNNIDYLFEIIYLIYDIYDNINKSDIKSLINEEKAKNFTIYFLQFEKYSRVFLENIKNIFYKKIGYVFCDFKGNISNKNKYNV